MLLRFTPGVMSSVVSSWAKMTHMQVELPQNARAKHGRTDSLSSGESGPRIETPVESSSDAVSSIEADDLPLCDEVQLPQEDEQDGYQGILWQASYRPDGIRTEAKIIHEGFAQLLAQELVPYFKTEPSLSPKAEVLAEDLKSWVELGRLRQTFNLWIDKSRMNKDGEIYQVVRKCEEETTTLGRKVLERYEALMDGRNGGQGC
jgi:hypothetical protein